MGLETAVPLWRAPRPSVGPGSGSARHSGSTTTSPPAAARRGGGVCPRWPNDAEDCGDLIGKEGVELGARGLYRCSFMFSPDK